jgi:membrane-associated protease RseP (regulator of RpoE activity)
MQRQGDARSFYLVKSPAEILRVEILYAADEAGIEEIAARMEKDLKAIGAAVWRKGFKSAGAEGYQIEGDLIRQGKTYHLIQTVLGENGRAYLITAVMPPEVFEAVEAELRAILESAAIGERAETEETEWPSEEMASPSPETVSPEPEEAITHRPATPSAELSAPPPVTVELVPMIRELEPPPGKPGWLGAEIMTVTPEVKKNMNLRVSDGVLVANVLPGGPAERAGLKKHDVITAFGGQNVRRAKGLAILVSEKRPGEEVEVAIMRGSSMDWVKLVVGERPDGPPVPEKTKGWLGAAIMTMTPEAAAKAGVSYFEGVLVVKPLPGGPAEKGGLKSNDIVRSFDGKRVSKAEELAGLAGEVAPGVEVKLGVIRDLSEITIRIIIESYGESAPDQ